MTLTYHYVNDLRLLAPEIFFSTVILIHLLFGIFTEKFVFFNNKLPVFKQITWLSIQAILLTGLISYLNPYGIGYFKNLLGPLNNYEYLGIIKFNIILNAILVLFLLNSFIEKTKLFEFEYTIIIELATLALLALISSFDLLTVYIILELVGLTFYILTCYNRYSELSTEAGLKYLLVGAFASGLFLIGSAGLYLAFGVHNLKSIFPFINLFDYIVVESIPLLVISTSLNTALIVLIITFSIDCLLLSITIKIGAFPFFKLLADTYHGAPIISVVFFAITSKFAYFGLFINFFLIIFYFLKAMWSYPIIVLALFSIIISVIKSLTQLSIKRFFAYTTLTHIGLLLLLVNQGSIISIYTLFLYLYFYNFTIAGLFVHVISLVSNNRTDGKIIRNLTDLRGLGQYYSFRVGSLSQIFFNFAAIPPLPGFFSKIMLFFALIDVLLMRWFIYCIAFLSFIGSIYYIRIIKLLFFIKPLRKYPILGNLPPFHSLLSSLILIFFFFCWLDIRPLHEAIIEKSLELHNFLKDFPFGF